MDAEEMKKQFDPIVSLMKDNTLKEREFWDGKLLEWKGELALRQDATEERVLALEKTFDRTFNPTEGHHFSPHPQSVDSTKEPERGTNQKDQSGQQQRIGSPRVNFPQSEVFETPVRTTCEVSKAGEGTAFQLYGGAYPRLLNVNALQPFDGQSSWVDYERQFGITATFYGWNEEEKAYALAMQLRGEALTVLSALPSAKPINFEALTKLLRQRFSLDRNRVQKPKETLAGFAIQFQRLSVAAFPDCAEKVVGEIVLSQFVDGIRDEQVQNLVAVGRPQSLQDTLGIALDITTHLERRGHKHVFMSVSNQLGNADDRQNQKSAAQINRSHQLSEKAS